MIQGPAKEEVLLWRLSLSLPTDSLRLCQAVLGVEEREKGYRLLRPLHRRRHWAAWGQLRWLLGLCLGYAPEALRFSRGAHGKPRLQGSDLCFNMSHSGDHLLIAMAWRRPLGVDVEVVRPLPTMTALAERCLAGTELQAWQRLSGRRRVQAFFDFWTGKEAFMKADGRGLILGVKRCVLALDPLRLCAIPEECGRADEWWLTAVAAGDTCRAALCLGGTALPVRQVVLPPTWLPPVRRQRPLRAS